MTAEAAALAWLRNPARNVDEMLAALNAMCSGQSGTVAEHLSVCACRIEEDTPDVWEPELPETNNGRGEFDKASGAVPLFMTMTGGI